MINPFLERVTKGSFLPVRANLLAEILHQVDKIDELWAKLS